MTYIDDAYNLRNDFNEEQEFLKSNPLNDIDYFECDGCGKQFPRDSKYTLLCSDDEEGYLDYAFCEACLLQHHQEHCQDCYDLGHLCTYHEV